MTTQGRKVKSHSDEEEHGGYGGLRERRQSSKATWGKNTHIKTRRGTEERMKTDIRGQSSVTIVDNHLPPRGAHQTERERM